MRHASGIAPFLAVTAAALAQTVDPHLRVDQFGYRPNARKVAVLRAAVNGFDAPAPYTPGPVIEVRRVADGAVVWSGAPAPWNGGAVHADSGDRCWHVDLGQETHRRV